jgi:Zn-dependent protease with chaperone function
MVPEPESGGSGKGWLGLLIITAALIGILIAFPQVRIALLAFIAISVVIGVVITFLLRAYYNRKPITEADEDSVRLNLDFPAPEETPTPKNEPLEPK